MVEVFREVRRVLRDDGTCWLNIGDSYAQNEIRNRNGESDEFYRPCRDGVAQTGKKLNHGLKPKDLCMMPWRVALALQADGWWIRSVIVWAKKSPMPESCRDRPTSSWEPIFLLSKSERYFYDAEAVKETSLYPDDNRKARQSVVDCENMMGENGRRRAVINPANATAYPTRNLRNVWHLGPEPYAEAHYATFPTEIPRRAIKAGTSEKGCCPACGAGWVRVVERTAYTPETVPVGIRNVDASRGDKVRKLSGKEYNEQASSRTLGWTSACACNAGTPVPCLVLDPFLGSGTTVAVARELGRHGVGIELNPEYADLARVRIGKAEKPQTFVDHRAPAPAGLFAEGQ